MIDEDVASTSESSVPEVSGFRIDGTGDVDRDTGEHSVVCLVRRKGPPGFVVGPACYALNEGVQVGWAAIGLGGQKDCPGREGLHNVRAGRERKQSLRPGAVWIQDVSVGHGLRPRNDTVAGVLGKLS